MRAVLLHTDRSNIYTELLVDKGRSKTIHFYEKLGYKISQYREIEENKDEELYFLMVRSPKMFTPKQCYTCGNVAKLRDVNSNLHHCSRTCRDDYIQNRIKNKLLRY